MQDGRAWPNFKRDYLPMVDNAAAAGCSIVAANAPRRYVSLVGRHGLSSLPLHTTPLATATSPTAASTVTEFSSSGKEYSANGLPTSPDAIAPPSEALMSKIRREMMVAQQASSAAEPVCGTPTPPTKSRPQSTAAVATVADRPSSAATQRVKTNTLPADTAIQAVSSRKCQASQGDTVVIETAASTVATGGQSERGSEGGSKGDSENNTGDVQKECPYSGMRLSDNFFAAQALWDATMADSILSALKNNACNTDPSSSTSNMHETQEENESTCGDRGWSGGSSSLSSPLVMHVCGKFHMEEGLGICEHLKRRCPQVTYTTVAITPVDLPLVRRSLEEAGGWGGASMKGDLLGLPGDLRKMGDFVVLTDGTTPRSF